MIARCQRSPAIVDRRGHAPACLRADGVRFNDPERIVDLRAGSGQAAAVWSGFVESPGVPWIAMVIPDGDINARREISGFRR